MLLLQPSIFLRLGPCVDILYAIATAVYIFKARSMCGHAIAIAFYIFKARSMCGHTIYYCYSLLYL